jgi:hypothetical protein
MTLEPKEAAVLMRELDEGVRNRSIAASRNVFDARPFLNRGNSRPIDDGPRVA